MFKTSFRGGAVLCVAALFLSGFALAVGIPVVVPDTGNNRVLIYYSPSGNGAPADVVLGQSSFTTGASGTSSSAMSAPTAFTFDSSGNLYVSDSGNCRVLMFAPPFATGQDASLVIGQPDFTTGCGAAASASTVGTTGGIAFGPHGNFWVADSRQQSRAEIRRALEDWNGGERGHRSARLCLQRLSQPSLRRQFVLSNRSGV